jgi:hypothetical protein
MIFGLGMTYALAGTMRYVYAGRATEQRLVYSLFALIVLAFLRTIESAIGAPLMIHSPGQTSTSTPTARHHGTTSGMTCRN